ncbi:MAG: CHASE domain-containing protein [Verrucomicrobiota bacterium]
MVALITGGFAVYFTKPVVNAAAQREFNFDCQEIQDKTIVRMRAHEQILRSGAAFYSNAKDVNRQEWRQFATRQRFEQQLPGIQGLGFTLLVPRGKLAQHIQEIRAEGFPSYQVRPEDSREIYSSIIYLEPFTNRNLRAFGYDMLTEPIRRTAMERARDQDAAALSGKVTLVQETDEDVQAGTLMYLPVYRQGMPIETVDQRRVAILGWVYSPYRMRDLMQGILGGWGGTSDRQIHLEVYDGETITPETLLYDSQSTEHQLPATAAHLTGHSRIVSAGRQWTLKFTKNITPASRLDFIKLWLKFFGGTSAGLLLGWVIFNLIKTRLKARQLANRLNTELRESEARLSAMLKATADGFLLVDSQGKILLANPQFAKLWRIPDELIRAGRDELVLQYGTGQLANPEEFLQDVQRLYASEIEQFHTLQFKDGRVFERYTNIVKIDGRQIGRLWSFRDITAQKQAEIELQRTTHQTELLLDSVGEGVYGLDTVGNTTFANPVAAKLLGYTAAELLKKPQHHLIHHHHADGTLYQVEECPIYAAIKDGNVRSVDNEVFWRKDGTSFPVDYTSTPVRNDTGQITGAVVVFRDNTARKLANEKIKASLHEKEVLLKEVHHRVKNNLQIVTSLLNLQMRQTTNPTVAVALTDTKERILSMALLHESLYLGGNLSEIDFAAYVKNLCTHLARSYGATERQIQLVTDVPAVTLNLESAIPCGLLITELVTNALKHAFPAGRAGKIFVAIQPADAGRLMLSVTDDGVGFTTETAPAQLESLGMQLVHTLAGQLGGVIEHESGGGTVFRLIFGSQAEAHE